MTILSEQDPKPRKHEVANQERIIVDNWSIIQQFDDYGNHRIQFGSFHSDWTEYEHIAVMDIKGNHRFAGTSEYYGETLPRVFKIVV